ncbi:MAG TPA: IS30 family transposase [Lachnospiraceae bacterium]|nr:IS30 family transposase [Lachnospiraceae bacterium]
MINDTFKDSIHVASKQLTISDRQAIYSCLERGMNLTDTAKYVHASISTIKREIDRNKQLKILNMKNNCGKKEICSLYNVCGNTHCGHSCSTCIYPNYGCNQYCKEYNEEPQCKLLKKHCGVCIGCEKITTCKLNKWIYNSERAETNHKSNLTEARSGCMISYEERKRIAELLLPFLKKNISIDVIVNSLKDQIPYSVQSIYTWVNKKYLPSIDNVYLLRKLSYKARKVAEKPQDDSKEYLQNRYYVDFEDYVAENPQDEVVELDSVEGVNKKSYIVTMLFRKSNYMMAFKVPDHTSESVVNVFQNIKKRLGIRMFKETFKVILTDRGCEFKLPQYIEADNDTGELLTRVYYCDSRQSQQKGKIEKNHEELRKIFPKGVADFNYVSQKQLNLALSHINSYPRRLFGFGTPYKIAVNLLPKEVFELNDCKEVRFSNLNLSQSLIK